MGLLRHALDVVRGAAWTPGSGGTLLQCPCLYSFSTPARDVFIPSICDTSHCTHTHTHTHTHTACTHKATTFVSSPGFYRSSAELHSAQVMSQGSLCGTVTQTGSSGSSKPFSGTSAQRGFACTRGFPELCGFHPDPRVPLPRSLPALKLEAEPGSLRVGGRGSKNWGRGKRELGVGGGLGGWQVLVGRP